MVNNTERGIGEQLGKMSAKNMNEFINAMNSTVIRRQGVNEYDGKYERTTEAKM